MICSSSGYLLTILRLSACNAVSNRKNSNTSTTSITTSTNFHTDSPVLNVHLSINDDSYINYNFWAYMLQINYQLVNVLVFVNIS